MNLPPSLHNALDFIALVDPGAVLPMTAEARLYDPLTELVGSKAASKILVAVGAEGVARMAAAELAAACNVTTEIAERVVAARHVAERLATRRVPASCPPEAIAALPPGLPTLEMEVVLAIALTRDHRVKAVLLVAKGGDAIAAFAPRDVFRPLVRLGAASFLLAHNHPGGSAVPSEEDIVATNTIAAAGDILGLTLVDHLIVGATETASLFELGLLPETERRPALAAAESDGAP